MDGQHYATMPERVMVMERWSIGKKAKKQWSPSLKKELVMRLLRGEPIHGVSREMAVPIYKLERWRNCVLAAVDAALKDHDANPDSRLEDAYKRIDELSLEIETLRKRRRTKCSPLSCEAAVG